MKDDGKTPESPIESPNLSPLSGEVEVDTGKVSAVLPKEEPAPEGIFQPMLSKDSELGRNRKMLSDNLKPEPSASTHVSEEAAADASDTTGGKDADQSNEEALNCLKEKIQKSWEQCEKLYLEIGKYLLEAKGIFGKHGDWHDWLKANVPFSIRQAQRLRRVAERFGNNATLVSHLDFSKAYILTRLPETKEEDFLQFLASSDPGTDPLQIVQALNKRELENKIRDYISSLSVSRYTREVEETEVNTSTAARCSALETFSHLRDQMNGLLQDVMDQKVDETEYNTLIADIREFFENTLADLPSPNVEPE